MRTGTMRGAEAGGGCGVRPTALGAPETGGGGTCGTGLRPRVAPLTGRCFDVLAAACFGGVGACGGVAGTALGRGVAAFFTSGCSAPLRLNSAGFRYGERPGAGSGCQP
jgi:hypothetical protein